MSGKVRSVAWITLILISIATIGIALQNQPVKALPDDWITVYPASYEGTTIGEEFTIKINISVADLAGFEYKFRWNNTLLNVTQIDITPPWSGYFIGANETSDLGDGRDQHLLGVAALPITGWTGEATICTYTFKVIYAPYPPEPDGYSLLDLEDTKFSDPAAQPIIHDTYDGEYTIKSVMHDIAVTHVTPSTDIKYLGGIVRIEVTVDNIGTENETFPLTVYVNTTAVETKDVTVIAHAARTFVFTWNTTGEALGKYTIKAEAGVLPHETKTEDNTLTDGTVSLITLPENIPYLEVDPPIVDVTPADGTFTVNVWIKNLDEDWNLAGWEFRLWYNTAILDVVTVGEGAFLKGFGSTYFVAKYGKEGWDQIPLDSTFEKEGSVLAGCTLISGSTPYGEGIIATITFNATGTGTSAIVLYNPWSQYLAKLSDTEKSYIPVIPEFPAAMIMLILLIGTLIATVLARKQSEKPKLSLIVK